MLTGTIDVENFILLSLTMTLSGGETKLLGFIFLHFSSDQDKI